MHEASIAVELVDQVVQTAQNHHAFKVEEVDVLVGVMREIVPEALELTFSATSAGTIAEGAKLRIMEERIIAVCRVCDCLFAPEHLLFMCPRCRQADARIVAGNDILLKSLKCQTAEEVAA